MKYRIGDLCTYMGSGGTPSRKNKEYYQNGHIKWLKTKELNDGNIYNTEEHITSEALSKSSAKLFPINTITMAMYGATVGKLGVMKTECATNQACCNMVANDKKIDYRFLYYSLLINRDKLINLANGAAQQNLNKGIIENFEIDYYEINEQKSIAHILSTLDDRIEVNNQINKTLENMAQAIFKQWFVDFEFPNEDGEPYKSSGGEMVESELGLIPKGWGVGEISDVVEFLGGFSFMSKDYLETGKYKVITIKNVLDGKFDSSSVKYLDIIPEKVKDVQKLEKGDILMSLTGNVARVCIVSENDCLLNQRVAKIQEKSRFSRGYIYVLFRSQLVKEILLAIAKGTAQLNLSPVEAQKMKIIIPCDKVIDKISVIYDSLFNLLLQSTDEIKLLEKFRDSLLPKLMSGEIRVPMDEEGDAS